MKNFKPVKTRRLNEYKNATLTKNFLTSENTSSEYKFNFLHTFFL